VHALAHLSLPCLPLRPARKLALPELAGRSGESVGKGRVVPGKPEDGDSRCVGLGEHSLRQSAKLFLGGSNGQSEAHRESLRSRMYHL
jgi:hypothetical protein